MRFCIITAVLNSGPPLKRTVDSLLAQTCPDWRQIIQDGAGPEGSRDGSVDFLAGLGEQRIVHARQADSGIYEAWNLAVAAADGDWVLFLGAGDRLLHGAVLAEAAKNLEKLPDKVIFAYGDLLLGSGRMPRERIGRSLRTVYSMMFTTLGLPFPATFIRLAALKARPFDASFRIAGDYDFVAASISSDNVARLPLAVSFMEAGGISGDKTFEALLDEERRRVAETRVMPRAEEIMRGCLAHIEEPACCGGKKRLRFLARLRLMVGLGLLEQLRLRVGLDVLERLGLLERLRLLWRYSARIK